MRNRQPSPEQAAAASRRLAALSAELAAVRDEDGRDQSGPRTPPSHTRVRTSDRPEDVARGPRPAAPLEPPEQAPPPITLAAPGRHAARRRALDLPGGLRLGAAHLAVVVAVVTLAVGVAAWLAVRHQGEPAAVPRVSPVGQPLLEQPGTGADAASPTGAATGGADGQGPGDEATEVVVDVAGKVRRPGIAVLPAGSRVVDALEAAGGARGSADLTGLNLARVLVDGEQVLVGVTAPPGVAGSPGAPAPEPGVRLVSLNTADQATLETLPGVGPVTATAILDWRAANGGFTAVEELLEVDGIGEATLADLAPLVTL